MISSLKLLDQACEAIRRFSSLASRRGQSTPPLDILKTTETDLSLAKSLSLKAWVPGHSIEVEQAARLASADARLIAAWLGPPAEESGDRCE